MRIRIKKNKLNKIFLILFLILITFPLIYNNTKFWLETIRSEKKVYRIPEGYPVGHWTFAFMKQTALSKSIFSSNPYARTETPETWFFLPVNIAGKIVQAFNADINVVYVIFSIISYAVIFIGGCLFFKKCLRKHFYFTFIIFLIGGGSGLVLPLIVSLSTGQNFSIALKETTYYGSYYDFFKKPEFNYALGFALISLAYLSNPLISVIFSTLSIFTHPFVAVGLVAIFITILLVKIFKFKKNKDKHSLVIKYKNIEKKYLFHIIPIALYLIYYTWAGITDPSMLRALNKFPNDFVYSSVTEGFLSNNLSNLDFWNFVFQNFFYKHLSLIIIGLIGFYLLFKNKEDIVNKEYKPIILLGFLISFIDLIPNFFPFALNIPMFRLQISRIKYPFLAVLFVIGLVYLFNKIKNKNKMLSFIFLGFILAETITYTTDIVRIYLFEVKSPYYGYHIGGTNYIVWEYLKYNLTKPSLVLVHPDPIGKSFLAVTTQHKSLCYDIYFTDYDWHEECVVEYTNEFWSPKASPEQKRAFLDKYNVSYVWIDPYMLVWHIYGENKDLFNSTSNPIQILYDSFMNIPGTEIVFGVVTDYPMDLQHIATLPSILLKVKR